jgi:ribose 5-phosphate isomerase A
MAAPTNQDHLKQISAESAASEVTDGMVVGLGTGSTAKLAVDALGVRVRKGLKIVGIPTSERTATQAKQLGIPLATLADYAHIDLTIDGADEVQLGTLHLIKGHGGALLREKIVASASRKFTVIVDQSKLVEKLGTHFEVPIEVVQFGWQAAARKLQELGGKPAMRMAANGTEPFMSDGGHYIIDCAFGAIPDPEGLAKELDSVVGVVEHGLFLRMCSKVLVGEADGVKTLTPNR